MTDCEASPLGHPRIHLRRTDSTNERARLLAIAGAPHGTVVTAEEQSAGRGRQGRSWLAPPRSALLCSLVLRSSSPLLSLIAGVAVCDVAGDAGRVKWPNDVVVGADLRKLAGILVEGRPQEGWAVLGIGLNVALPIELLPAELRARAASLELEPGAIEPTFERLLEALASRLAAPIDTTLDAWRARDALYGRDIAWDAYGSQSQAERGSQSEDKHRPQRDGEHGSQSSRARGRAEGIDEEGQLLVRLQDGTTTVLSAGEVHLESLG